MHISKLLRAGTIAFAFTFAAGAQPATQPSYTPPPQYPVPYVLPKVDEIKQTLDRVRQRLETGVAVRVIDSKTGEPITDFSTQVPNAIMDRGEGKRFPVISYPMGVINSGMLLAAEVTGDAKYSDFVVKQYQYFNDNYAVLEKWGVTEPNPRKNPFWNFYKPDSLDACGAMGAAMVKARRMNVGPDMKVIINRWAN